MASPYSARDEQKLMSEIWDPAISENLENFVLFIFPWGKKNTPLERFKGPRNWQRDELQKLTEVIRNNKNKMTLGKLPEMDQSATCSGRGPGKSALSSFISLWMMSCQLGSTTIISANSEDQLINKTWGELGTWHTLMLNSHWFDKSARHIRPAEWFKTALKKDLKIDDTYYYIHAQLWAEERPDAFAGAHNPKGICVIFDEASGIPKPIWTVTKGFFTEPVLHRYWAAYSNPRRNTGEFFECFNGNREQWRTRVIDSRSVEGTDPKVYQDIINQHGVDSDEARIEVYGQFPRQGDDQFISSGLVADSVERVVADDEWAPLMMGVDPARFGDDTTVICFRQGRNAKLLPFKKLKGKNNMEVANLCADLINQYNPDAVCIDAGAGSGIIDRLKELRYRNIHEVGFGTASEKPEWANKRTELWARMRDWLPGGVIPDDKNLRTDLCAPKYFYMAGSDKKMLESKEDMKKRGLASPDNADALALTFAVRPARRDLDRARGSRRNRVAKDVDYQILG